MYVCTFVRLHVHLKRFVALKLQSSSKWEDYISRLSLMGDGPARWYHVDELNCVSVIFRTLYMIVLQNSDTQAGVWSNSVLSRFCEVKSVFPYALWTRILEHSTKEIYCSTVSDCVIEHIHSLVVFGCSKCLETMNNMLTRCQSTTIMTQKMGDCPYGMKWKVWCKSKL